jgi:tetratricopeptide (TPR) repeat protein
MRTGILMAGFLLFVSAVMAPAEAHGSWLVQEFRNFSSYPRIQKAYDYYDKGNYIKARNLLQSAVKIDPKNVEAHSALAETCLKLKDLSCAKRQGKALNRLNPKSPAGNFVLARVANLENNPSEVIRAAESALQFTGLKPAQQSELVQLLVDNLIKTGNIDQAGAELLKLKQQKTDPTQLKAAYDRLIDFCFVEKDVQKGLKWYREYLKRFGPAGDRTLIYWSNLLVEHGDIKNAYQIIETLPSRGTVLTHKVNLLEKLGQYHKAAKLLEENATPVKKKSVQYWRRLAILYNKAGDIDLEFKTLVQGIKTVKNNTPLYHMAIDHLIKLKGYSRAIPLLKAEIKEDGTEASRMELVRLYEKENQYKKAIRDLYPLWGHFQGTESERLKLSHRLLYLLQKEKEWPLYLKVMLHELRSEKSKGADKGNLQLPADFFTGHHLKEKIKELEAAYPFHGISENRRFELIMGLIRLEQRAHNEDRAREMLQELTRGKALNPPQLERLASLAYDLAMYKEALTLSQEVIARTPSSVQGHLIAGYCAQKLNKPDKAITFLNGAARIDPGLVTRSFQIGLGSLYAETGEKQKALRQWRAALDQRFDPELALKMARLYYDQKETKEARALLSRIDPTSFPRKKGAEFWSLKGLVADESGDAKSAAAAYRKSLSLWESAQTWAQLGYNYIRQGKKPSAIKAFEEAALLAPENGSYRSSLAYLYWETGKPKEAAAAFREAISLEPDNIALYKGLGYAEIKTGNYKGATDTFKHVIDYYADDPAKKDPKTADEIYRIKQTINNINQRWHFDFAEVVRLDNSHFEPQPSLIPNSSYSGFGVLSGDYRMLQSLGPLNTEVSVFGRLLWTNQNRSLAIEKALTQAGLGVSVKPLGNYDIHFSMERIFGVGSDTQNDVMVRASASFNEGTYWHPGEKAWGYYDLYLDAAYLLDSGQHYLTSNFQWGRAFKVRDAWALVPYFTSGAVDSNGNTWIDAGAGITLAIWGFEDHYHAHRLLTRITLEGRQQLAGNSPDEHTVRLKYEMRF